MRYKFYCAVILCLLSNLKLTFGNEAGSSSTCGTTNRYQKLNNDYNSSNGRASVDNNSEGDSKRISQYDRPQQSSISKDATIYQCPLYFNTAEHQSVNHDVEYLFTITYNETKNETKAVRVMISTDDYVSDDSPLLIVVRQPRHIISWQVPETGNSSGNVAPMQVNRTLCPLELAHKSGAFQEQEIHVDISTASKKDIAFNLTATLVPHFMIELEFLHTFHVGPSSPMYYQYTFDEGVDSVLIKVESPDEICMIVSVQDVQCPVYDLQQNVKFGNTFQTVTTKGAIRVSKSDFQSGALFIVFVVENSDEECLGNSWATLGTENFGRIKTVDIKVSHTLSENQYVNATLALIAWFVVFYVIAFVISCGLHFRVRDDIVMNEPIIEDSHAYSSIEDEQRLLENDAIADVIVYSSENAPLLEEPSHASRSEDSTYGAMSPASSTSGYGNGVPHVVNPPGSDDNSVDETEIDTLADISVEKDVYRSKLGDYSETMLYVSDLAKKSHRRLNKKYKLYSWNLLLIVIFYGLPVIQLVITYQKILNLTGNEDMCFYNFYCANSLNVLSAFNNVFSNIGYMMLGILFLILVYRRDVLHKRRMKANSSKVKFYGIPEQYGLCYALGLALFMEGILSGCYHVCPSYSNFQFDTSFMYMIGWLLMLKIYQQRHPDVSPAAYIAYNVIAVLIFIVVVGVTSGTPTAFWIFYAVLHVVISIFLSLQIYYMGRWRLDRGMWQRCCLYLHSDILRCSRPLYPDRLILLIICCAINWAIMIYGVYVQPVDFASFLVSIVILNLLMYFAFYIIMKLRHGERLLPAAIIYSVLATLCWGLSFYFFIAKLTSWQGSAAQSRAGNRDCILFHFYDDHDVWHVLSSMSLFFSFMTILILDDDLVNTRRDRIPVF